MNKRHYEHTLPNIRGSLSNTYLLLVFISEIVLVLYLITNIVSSRETFDIWTQMILLALPLFFFLLIIVPIGHREREPLP